MKKTGKILIGSLSLAAVVGGVIYYIKNMSNKEKIDDDDYEFEDDFFENDDTDNKNDVKREYVTITKDCTELEDLETDIHVNTNDIKTKTEQVLDEDDD